MTLTDEDKDFIKKYLYFYVPYIPHYKYRIITNKFNKSFLQRKRSFFGSWEDCDIGHYFNNTISSEEYEKFLEIKSNKHSIIFLFNIKKEKYIKDEKLKKDEETIIDCEYIK